MMKKKRFLFTSIFFLGISLVAVLSITLAWFWNITDANTGTISFEVEDAPFAQISFDGLEWRYSVILERNGHLKRSVSGLGTKDASNNLLLWYPLQDEYTGVFELDDAGNYQADIADLDGDYFEFDLYIRSTEPCDVSIDKQSYVRPHNLNERKKIFYDNLPADYIAGAVRISFSRVNDDGTETLDKIWVPNTDYQLNHASTWSVLTGSGTEEEDIKYFDGTDFLDADSRFVTDLPTDLVVTVPASDGMCYAHYIVRMWVEGTDREADSALAGGIFDSLVVFVAKEHVDGP